MESGFSSPRTDAFPAGLRVLVVDDDPTWLKILEKMLKKCSYEVTTRSLARDALNLLRERKDGFDIVISDVNMPDMDGFKLLEHVGLEMDLPVIMMSVDGETSRVMKGVQHGACDYLLKPIRMKELRNIWQHVFRKRMHEVRDFESHDGFEEMQIFRNGLEQSDEVNFFSGDVTSGRKRKDSDSKHDEKDFGEPSSGKKARVVWTVELHQKFVKAVDLIGFDKVGPKKILDLMNVPWLTRENVASHLQKYRLYLSRLQKDNDLNGSFGGIRNSETSPKDSAGSIGPFNLIKMQQDDAVSGNYAFPGSTVRVQNVDPTFQDSDEKCIVSLPTIAPKKSLIGDTPVSLKANCSMGGLNHSLGSLEPDINYAAFDSSTTPYSWSGDIPAIQYKDEHNKHLHLDDGFNQLPFDRRQCVPSVNPIPYNTERDKTKPFERKPSYAKYGSDRITHVASVSSAIDLFSRLSESTLTDPNSPDPIPTTSLSSKLQGLNHTFINNSESTRRNVVLGSSSSSGRADRDLKAHLLPCEDSTTYVAMPGKECFDYDHLELVPEIPLHVYDALRFDYESPNDLMEYPVIDQGVFIA